VDSMMAAFGLLVDEILRLELGPSGRFYVGIPPKLSDCATSSPSSPIVDGRAHLRGLAY
jgi:hypothetical protein